MPKSIWNMKHFEWRIVYLLNNKIRTFSICTYLCIFTWISWQNFENWELVGNEIETWIVLLYVNVGFRSVFSYCTPLINIIHKKVKGWPLWGWTLSSCSSKYQFVSLIFNKVFLFEFLHAVKALLRLLGSLSLALLTVEILIHNITALCALSCDNMSAQRSQISAPF